MLDDQKGCWWGSSGLGKQGMHMRGHGALKGSCRCETLVLAAWCCQRRHLTVAKSMTRTMIMAEDAACDHACAVTRAQFSMCTCPHHGVQQKKFFLPTRSRPSLGLQAKCRAPALPCKNWKISITKNDEEQLELRCCDLL